MFFFYQSIVLLIIIFSPIILLIRIFKKKEDKKTLQEIYDFNFKQLELSIREIGYGDQSINKKMKEYLPLSEKKERSGVWNL